MEKPLVSDVVLSAYDALNDTHSIIKTLYKHIIHLSEANDKLQKELDSLKLPTSKEFKEDTPKKL